MSPLPLADPLTPFINFQALKNCIHDVVNYVQRATLVNSDNIGCVAEQFDTQTMYLFIKATYPQIIEELKRAIDVCIDKSVARKTKDPILVLEKFIFRKFHSIMKHLEQIHEEHTKKITFKAPCSLGPVPSWKLVEIRCKAQLPINDDDLSDHDIYN
jgi:hypothetical protein